MMVRSAMVVIMFALSTHVYFMMTFVDPTVDYFTLSPTVGTNSLPAR